MRPQAGIDVRNPRREGLREFVKERAARNGEERDRRAAFSKMDRERAPGRSGSDNRDIETHPAILEAGVEQFRQLRDAPQYMGMRLLLKPRLRRSAR